MGEDKGSTNEVEDKSQSEEPDYLQQQEEQKEEEMEEEEVAEEEVAEEELAQSPSSPCETEAQPL